MKKFKRFFLTLLFLGILYFLTSYSTESKKYEILNEIFTDTEFKPEKICIIKESIDFDKEIFNEFEFYDLLSVYSQFANQSAKTDLKIDDKIQENKISDTKIITDCSTKIKKIKIDEKTERWETNSNAQISLPVLSIDKKTAIIQISNNCGMLCGDTHLFVFKKINGKWKVINKKMLRIS